MNTDIRDFFERTEWFDRYVLKQLSHIDSSWELSWDYDNDKYLEEEGEGFGKIVNQVITELSMVTPPAYYHDHEDRLAEYVQKHLKWRIRKIGKRWVGEDYEAILEQGGFHDLNEHNLILAVAGRVRTAIRHNQLHFDNMDEAHMKILAGVLAVIIYHRWRNCDE